MTDPIADLLTRIRNANQALKPHVDVPSSRLKREVLHVLRETRYIDSFDRPGLRKYVRAKEVPRVLGGLGVAVLTTPKGVMSDEECRREHVGGEVICYIW